MANAKDRKYTHRNNRASNMTHTGTQGNGRQNITAQGTVGKGTTGRDGCSGAQGSHKKGY